MQSLNGFLIFNYDTTTYDSSNKIIAHAVRLLDYTPGGPEFDTVKVASGELEPMTTDGNELEPGPSVSSAGLSPVPVRLAPTDPPGEVVTVTEAA